MVHFLSYKQIIEILETSPSRMLEYNVEYAAVYRFKAKFHFTDSQMDLNDILLFLWYEMCNCKHFWKELVKKRIAVPCANGFWQRKFGLKVDKAVWCLAVKATQQTSLCNVSCDTAVKIYTCVFRSNVCLQQRRSAAT